MTPMGDDGSGDAGGNYAGSGDAECWVDVFESDYFMGRRRRLQGPQKLRKLAARSMIVGPKAAAVLSVERGKKHSTVRLSPRRVVPDLQKYARATNIGALTVEAVE